MALIYEDTEAQDLLNSLDNLMEKYPIRITVEGVYGAVSGTMEYQLFGEWTEVADVAHCHEAIDCIRLLIEVGTPAVLG